MKNGRPFAWLWERLPRALHKILSSNQLQRKRSWKSDDVEAATHKQESKVGLGVNVRASRGFSKGLGASCYNPVATVLILTVAWVVLYTESLVGGDLHRVVHSLGRIAVAFFSSIACFVAAVYIAVFDASIAGRTRAILLGVILTSLSVLFLLDHGGSLRHHGAYNMLMFAIFVVPALLMSALEYMLWRVVGIRALLAIHLPFVIFGCMFTTGALQQGRADWARGFRGERLLPLGNRSVCAPVDRGLPWVDVFPEGSQNFGAGVFTCGDLQKESDAVRFAVTFTAAGELTVRCDAGAGMTYTAFPSTVDWPKEEKLIEETYEGALVRPFNKNVMDKVREAGETAYEAHIPAILPAETEAVIVRCGGVEKLVTRVRPRRELVAKLDPIDEKLNVMFVFLDATSRRGFHRRLRRTVAALEEADARGATRLYQFFRYNVVAFCTEPNSRAMFQNTIRAQNDIVPPIWEDYRDAGYVTLFTADTCQDLAAAYMNRWSPHHTPSFDHELVAPFCHSDFFAEDANPFGNFKGPYSITVRCLKGEQVHEHELRYLESFRTAYPNHPKFSLSWFLEGHEGTTEVLRNLDDALAAHLRNLSSHDWNTTALIIAADHGLHMGLNFGVAQNGAVEHKNPFLAVMLPPWFTDRHGRHEAMTANQQRMVTALDIYSTLQAIRTAGLSDEQRRQWVDPAAHHRLSRFSTDLLHQEVPASRTCQDAGIPPEWCQCL